MGRTPQMEMGSRDGEPPPGHRSFNHWPSNHTASDAVGIAQVVEEVGLWLTEAF